MPAFFTHYSLGVKNYRSMQQSQLKNLIKKYKKTYSLGTLGPDIFFYYFPHILLQDKKPASVMHEKASRQFFEAMLKRAERFEKQEEREIAYTYIAGFIGHYELDVHCHPYVYSVTESDSSFEESGEHFTLEAAMDVFCSCEYLHKLPTELKQRELITLSKEEKQVLCMLLADSYNRIYHYPRMNRFKIGIVLNFVQSIAFLLEDKHGMKEKIWSKGEKLIFGHPVTAPLFMNNSSYEYTVEDWYQFHELWKEGFEEYQKIMPYFDAYITSVDKKEARKELLSKVGNHSYHRGKNKCD